MSSVDGLRLIRLSVLFSGVRPRSSHSGEYGVIWEWGWLFGGDDGAAVPTFGHETGGASLVSERKSHICPCQLMV